MYTRRDMVELYERIQWLAVCFSRTGRWECVDAAEMCLREFPMALLAECAWCGTDFAAINSSQKFCGPDCKRHAAVERRARG